MPLRLWAKHFGLLFLGAGGSLIAALATVHRTPLLTLALFGLLLGSCATVILGLRPDHVFLSWLFLAPFVQNAAFDTPAGTYLGVGLYAIPVLVFALWTVANRPQIRLTWVDTLPALYGVYVLISVWSGPGLGMTSAREFYFAVGVGVIVYYFCAFGPLPSNIAPRMAFVVLASSIAMSAMAIIETFTGWNLWGDVEWHEGFSRSVATLSNPAVLGAFLGMAIGAATAALSWPGASSLRRVSILTLLLGWPALFFTYTRGPIIATMIAAGSLFVISRHTRWAAVASSAIVALVAVVSWGALQSTNVYQERLGNQGNIEERLLLQDWSLDLVAERPITGWGIGSFDRVKQRADFSASSERALVARNVATSHNTFLTILVELGLLGFCLFVLPLVTIATQAISAVRRGHPEQWFLAAGVAAIFVYLFSASTIDMRFFSFVPALVWVFVGLLRRELSIRT